MVHSLLASYCPLVSAALSCSPISFASSLAVPREEQGLEGPLPGRRFYEPWSRLCTHDCFRHSSVPCGSLNGFSEGF